MSSTSSGLTATIVEAGAGTGKTQSLANRIIEAAILVYAQKNEIPRFVATTFTERATSELRERVVSLLSQRDAPEWLEDFVQDTENLHISTIHGTLSFFLHRYGSLLGLDPEFTIMKAGEERELLGQILRKAIVADGEFGVLLEHYPFKDLLDLVIKLLPHYRLHEDHFRPALGWRDVLLGEAMEVVEALGALKTISGDQLSGKSAVAVVALQGLHDQLSANTGDPVKIREIFLEVISFRRPSANVLKEYKDQLDVIFKIRDEWKKDRYLEEINARHDELTPILQSLIKKVSVTMTKEKTEQGLMAFDDLEFLSFELIQKHPEILQSWQREWDFWFIDEFQDTSPLQKKILFSFFRDPWNAFFVGDPQQSIYLFRGADENVFQETKKNVAARGGRLERLEVNHRSDPDLLRFLNLAFSHLEPPMNCLKARADELGEVRANINTVGENVDEAEIVLAQILEWRKLGYSYQDMAILIRKNSKARMLGLRLGLAGIPVYVHSSGGFYDRREILDALSLLSFIEDPSDDDAFVLLSRSPWLGIKDIDLAAWGQKRKACGFWEWVSENEEALTQYPVLKRIETGIAQAEILPLSQVFGSLLEDLGFWEFCLVDDASGRREANLRKLTWTLRRAEEKPNFSAAEFIDDAWEEALDTGEESEAASFIEPERVNIMTVHKSKGLKFNCVIIPYCGDSFRMVENPIELSPDGRWSTRVLSFDSEEKVGPLMHHSLRDERAERERAESQRVFYVALTRAAERISLIGSEKVSSSSWFGQVKIPLTVGDHENTYEIRHWDENPVFPKTESLVNTSSGDELVLKALPKEIQTNRLTVTQVVQSQIDKSDGVGEYDLKDQIEVQQRGQAVHYIFERVKYSGTSKIAALCENANRLFGISRGIDASLIKDTLTLREPPLLELIERGETEWPFVIRDGETTLRGQIDLWCSLNGATWIIDYKSTLKFTPENIKRAQDQLELYALAVHKTGVAWENIRLAVVAPFQASSKVLRLSPLSEVRARLKPMPSINSEAEI